MFQESSGNQQSDFSLYHGIRLVHPHLQKAKKHPSDQVHSSPKFSRALLLSLRAEADKFRFFKYYLHTFLSDHSLFYSFIIFPFFFFFGKQNHYTQITQKQNVWFLPYINYYLNCQIILQASGSYTLRSSKQVIMIIFFLPSLFQNSYRYITNF